MRQYIIALFETIAQVVTLLLEPFQFQTRKRDQELALERLHGEFAQRQLELVLEHTSAINSDSTTAMLKVADGFQKWLELFKTQSLPEAHTTTDEDLWREEQKHLRAGYRAAGLNVPADPEASLYAYDQAHGDVDSGPATFSPSTQKFLDDLYAERGPR